MLFRHFAYQINNLKNDHTVRNKQYEGYGDMHRINVVNVFVCFSTFSLSIRRCIENTCAYVHISFVQIYEFRFLNLSSI